MAPIFEEQPFAYVIWDSTAASYCHFCCSKNDNLLKCGQCRFARYCNKTCQLAAWKDHAQECKDLKKMHPKGLRKDWCTRLMARILIKLSADPKQLESREDGVNRTFGALMSHADKIRKDEGQFLEYLEVYDDLTEFIDPKYLPSTIDPLDIFGKIVINSVTIMDTCDYGLEIGTGLYLGMSACDHSCDPDAVIVFSGRKLVMNRVKNRDAEGSLDLRQVTISYVPTCKPTIQRRKLLEKYYFRCSCTYCLDEHKDQLKNALLCKYPNCGGPVLLPVINQGSGTCDKCGRPGLNLLDGVNKVVRALQQEEQLIQMSNQMPASDLFNCVAKVIDELRDTLHPGNVTYISIMKIAIMAINNAYNQILYSKEHKEWLRKFHKECMQGLRDSFPGPDPAITVSTISIGDLMLAFDFLGGADTYLEKATEMAKITHGENHEIFTKIKAYKEKVAAFRGVFQKFRFGW